MFVREYCRTSRLVAPFGMCLTKLYPANHHTHTYSTETPDLCQVDAIAVIKLLYLLFWHICVYMASWMSVWFCFSDKRCQCSIVRCGWGQWPWKFMASCHQSPIVSRWFMSHNCSTSVNRPPHAHSSLGGRGRGGEFGGIFVRCLGQSWPTKWKHKARFVVHVIIYARALWLLIIMYNCSQRSAASLHSHVCCYQGYIMKYLTFGFLHLICNSAINIPQH